jgi:hypothetical protein
MQIPDELLSRKFGLAIAAAVTLTSAMGQGVITGTVWAICLTVVTCFYCVGQGLAEAHFTTSTVMIPTTPAEQKQ